MKRWYEQTGPHGETVLASFVTLSRNIAGVPYPVRLNPPQKDALTAKAFAVLEAAGKPVAITRLRSLYPYEADSLAERLLISPAFAAAGEASKAGSCCDPYLRLSKALTTKNVITAVSAQGSMVVRSSKSSGF